MNYSGKELIIKNTLILYSRMFVTLLVSLYTSRVVLNVLGIEDYGIYNVLGGLVVILGFFSSSMGSATQRFLAFEIGRKDDQQLSKVFSMSINAYIIIALFILIIAETAGLWFVKRQLNLPVERLEAAIWVYQFSIFSFLITVITVPYNALILAYEKMNIYAWISIVDVIMKLSVVFILQWLRADKLLLFSILIFVETLIIRLSFKTYCNRNYSGSLYKVSWDKQLFKRLMSFMGWNLWGNSASVMSVQGINIMLNIFFGPLINAANGIAFQVRGIINSFAANYQVAMRPQIIKSFASEEIRYMHELIFQGARFSFLLLFALSLPVLFETEVILKLWLKNVPEYTSVFTKLILINLLIDSISVSLMTAAQASGKIKLYQGVVGGFLLLIIPISYLFLSYGYPPETTFIICIVFSVSAFFIRLLIIGHLIKLSVTKFFRKVIYKIIPVSVISILLPLVLHVALTQNIFRLFIVTASSIICFFLVTYFIGLDKSERRFFKDKFNITASSFKKIILRVI